MQFQQLETRGLFRFKYESRSAREMILSASHPKKRGPILCAKMDTTKMLPLAIKENFISPLIGASRAD